MDEQQIDNLVDGMENMSQSQLCLMDLAGELLKNIILHCDLKSHFMLKLVNQKLHRIEKETDIIVKEVTLTYQMKEGRRGATLIPDTSRPFDTTELSNEAFWKLLHDFIERMYAKKFTLRYLQGYENEEEKRIVKALFDINTHELRIHVFNDKGSPNMTRNMNEFLADIPPLTQNLEKLCLDFDYVWPMGAALSIFSTKMVTGECKLKSFSIGTIGVEAENFMRSHAGVEIVNRGAKLGPKSKVFTKCWWKFRAVNGPVEFYVKKGSLMLHTCHFDGNFKTTITPLTIYFDVNENPDNLGEKEYDKVTIAHLQIFKYESIIPIRP